jgi:hypothetical protein
MVIFRTRLSAAFEGIGGSNRKASIDRFARQSILRKDKNCIRGTRPTAAYLLSSAPRREEFFDLFE